MVSACVGLIAGWECAGVVFHPSGMGDKLTCLDVAQQHNEDTELSLISLTGLKNISCEDAVSAVPHISAQ